MNRARYVLAAALGAIVALLALGIALRVSAPPPRAVMAASGSSITNLVSGNPAAYPTGSIVSAGADPATGALQVATVVNYADASTPQYVAFALADGGFAFMPFDSMGNVSVYLASQIQGESTIAGVNAMQVAGGENYSRITTATTTVLKQGPGLFTGCDVGAAVASATITVYDNDAGSGTVMDKCTEPSTLLQTHYHCGPPLGQAFTYGLTVSTTGTDDMTCTWY